MGKWVEIKHRIYDSRINRCSLCGKALVLRYWAQDDQDDKAMYCDEDCARLWREYWLPRYGRKA